MDQSSPNNKSVQPSSIFDLLELDGDEDDDEYNPAEEDEAEDEEEEVVEDLFMGDPLQSAENSDIEMSEGDTIARRTRSKFQIEEEPKDTLEFPDVTEDLYEPAKGDDDEWLLFLNALYQDNPSRFFDEDEAKDPDYSVFEDVDELIEREANEASSHDLSVEPMEKIDIKSLSSTDLSEWSKFFTNEDIELLYHQMCQHIQLLTQQYLLTMTSQTLGSVAETASFLIKEINQFAQGKEISVFRTCNLPGALKIIEDQPINSSNITVTANSWRQCPVPLIVRPIIADNPHVFIYHDLLPRTGYPDVTVGEYRRKMNCKTKTKFNRAEDHLIALGLEQFKDVDKKHLYSYIRQLLVPVKSVEQIRMHVKNKKRNLNEKIVGKCDENNPLTYYLKHDKLMPIIRLIPIPKQSYSQPDELPEWLAKHLDPKFITLNKSKVLPRLKLSPLKGVYSLKYPSTPSSPNKQTSIVLRRYRYLSKLPYIKPKPINNPVQRISNATSRITVINLGKSPLISSSSSSSSPSSSDSSSSSSLSNSQQHSPLTAIETPVIDITPQVSKDQKQISSTKETEEDDENRIEIDVTESSDQVVTSSEQIDEIISPETTEEVISSETNEDIISSEVPEEDNLDNQISSISPGQSTNRTSMSDSPANPCSVEKDEQICCASEKESDQLTQNEDDDESDLAALMVASSTITSNKGRNRSQDTASGATTKKEAKKSLTTKHKESTILLLSEDWLLNDCNREQKEQIMVQCFVSKVREVLKSDDDYIQFLTYLSEFGQNRTVTNVGVSIKDLHYKTEKLLRKVNAQQLMEDFVLLLNASEAQECGKMYQYLHWRRYLSFIRKLEVYSAVEPNCIPRLHKTLIQLKSSETPIDKQRLKAAVSKAISGHPYLINEFSSLFLDEKPKDYLFASDEDFDNLVISNAQDLTKIENDGDTLFENVLVDLNADERKYGTNECPCKICHCNTNNKNNITNISSVDSVNSTSCAPSSSTNGTTPSNINNTNTNTTTTNTNNNNNSSINGNINSNNNSINNNSISSSIGDMEISKRNQPQTPMVPPLRHCAACSLKFIGGKIYLQGPKKIQQAEVQYTSCVKESRSANNQQQTTESQQKQVNSPIPDPSVSQSVKNLQIVSPSDAQESVSVDNSGLNDKPWSLSEDKLLLEFCKARVSSEGEANLIELFNEVATKLKRPCDNVVERFNKLMELFKNEASIDNQEIGETSNNQQQ